MDQTSGTISRVWSEPNRIRKKLKARERPCGGKDSTYTAEKTVQYISQAVLQEKNPKTTVFI